MKNPVTESLISALRRKAGAAPSRGELEFLRAYYHRLSRQDFQPERAREFRARALAHRRAGLARRRGETIIEIRPDESDTTTIFIVTDDRPFIVRSLLMKLNALGRTPLMNTHPLFVVTRDKNRKATKYERFVSHDQVTTANRHAESYVQFVTEFIPESERGKVIAELRKTIAEVRHVVRDWKKMHARAHDLAESAAQDPVSPEYGQLMNWLADDHFTFLGYCELEIDASTKGGKPRLVRDSALGNLRGALKRKPGSVLEILPPVVFTGDAPMVFSKSRTRAEVSRPGYMDCILYNHGFKKRARKSCVSCFLGFLPEWSAAPRTLDIPLVRDKVRYVLKSSRLREGGYAYKELRSILETLPREKLYQMESKELYALCMTLLNQERRKTRVHLYKNVCGHYYSCMVYVPRDVFNSRLREDIQDCLHHRLNARDVEFDVYFSESILTRIHYTIQADPNETLSVDPARLEREIQEISRNWNDKLYQAVLTRDGKERAHAVLEKFRDAFPDSYERDYGVDSAVTDIGIFESLAPGEIHAVLSPSMRPDTTNASFKIYYREISIALSDALPILEHMGVRILGGRPQKITATDGETFRIREFEICREDGLEFDYEGNAREFQNTFINCWNGWVENDGFNKLTLVSGLDSRRISMLRAYFRYLKQIRLRYSENYIIDALVNNPGLAVAASDLFTARFDPHANRKGVGELESRIAAQLRAVRTLDEERIIRALVDVLSATLRTNYFQPGPDGQPKAYISFKLKSNRIPRIPEPAPEFEIFLYSPRVEGVHLRGGPVARGGLRWSERPEDFRTEILGLVKAQRVKNAVIVPVGSKGGFVAKQLPAGDRDQVQQEVIACYRTFISSLLDVTDNLVGGKVIPPNDVVRWDDDDPYLVVAADKGTATFSDIANSISLDYGFWLGDAFASGGSAGYDHKKMGITARGAWESVKRHFRELGKDIQSEPFTVAGIGDMGGDVFGNGMLLSKKIKLVAAFNHLDIFIDPDPDPAAGYRERKRLFNLPGSAWTDYDRGLISRGGGVFSRSAKSIKLSPQARQALGVDEDAYTPNALINAILKSPVELLWNGGIGTYVKASPESHRDAQDRNNDGLRVDAAELRCKVIGEGGNLGMTQLARIEYAQLGGLCYTDAIDNSAGVDTSDHEVNIKILLNARMRDGKLSEKNRNALLAEMEEEVARLVLANNYLQTQVLSMEADSSHLDMPRQARAIQLLEDKGLLNRQLEFLPDDATLKERHENGGCLTRPELAVLLSYSKMDLYQQLLESRLPDNAFLESEIRRYFPEPVVRRYPGEVRRHRLIREIIATQLTNDLVGNMGPVFHLRLGELTGADAQAITAAYVAAREILGNTGLVEQVQALDNRVDAALQTRCFRVLSDCMEFSVQWLLRNAPRPLDIPATIKAFQPGFNALCASMEKRAGGLTHVNPDAATLEKAGVPKPLGAALAARQKLYHGLDVVDIARARRCPVALAAEVYHGLESALGLDWMQGKIAGLTASNTWHERSRFSLAGDLRQISERIAAQVISGGSKKTGKQLLNDWTVRNQAMIADVSDMVRTLREEAHPAPDFAMLSVVVSELGRFAQTAPAPRRAGN